MSNSLWSHGLQHAGLPCLTLSPRICLNSCPLSWWCHQKVASSVAPFFSCPRSFPASGSFQMSQFFASGGQSIGASASASVLPMTIQGWFPLGLVGLISLLSKGLSKVFTSTTVQKNQSIGAQSSLWSNSHIHTWPLETIALTRQTFTCKAMSLLFNMLSRLVKAFLSRSKHPLISWLQSPFAVTLESKKINLSLFPLFPHLFAMKLWDWFPWSWFFKCWVLSQVFTLLFHLQEAL